MGLLLPSFRVQVEGVVADMRAVGFNPRVFETWRSAERIAMLAAKGTGSLYSMHAYKIATDVIDARLMWNASDAFWYSYVKFSEARGLTCGIHFTTRHDAPHIQAVPVAKQHEFVALHGADEAETEALRDAYVQQFFKAGH
jgi:hypothetical protein